MLQNIQQKNGSKKLKKGTQVPFFERGKTMKLEFGKYTDITNFAKKVNPEMFKTYQKVYICPDTNNWWVAMIQEGYNEDYEECPGMYLVERNNPDYPDYNKCNRIFLNSMVVRNVLEEWDGSTWDVTECDSLEEAIEMVDGG